MTGREMIIFILANNLEDEVFTEDDMSKLFMTVEEAAVKFKVGEATIRAWYHVGKLKGSVIDGALRIIATAKDPRKE